MIPLTYVLALAPDLVHLLSQLQKLLQFVCVEGSEAAEEQITFLFISVGVSVNHGINLSLIQICGKMKDAFPPIFNLEVATMAMMNV